MFHMEEGIKGGDGGRIGGVGEDHEMMHCIHHPHRNNNNNTGGGGICAFCLQEKLGKLVSSSFPLNYSSSSPPPSFRSNTTTTAPTASVPASSSSSSLSLSVLPKKNNSGSESDHHNQEHNTRSRLPFLVAKKNKDKKKTSTKSPPSSSSSADAATSGIILKRSKSTATPRRENYVDDAVDDDIVTNEDLSPMKRNGFWSFLYPSSKSIRGSNGTPRIISSSTSAASGSLSSVKPREKCNIGASLGRKSDMLVVGEGGGDNNNSSSSPYISQSNASGSSFEGKVSRSRSVGCGGSSSRNLISGDFFERISNGFGDRTLRRVESQREGGKPNKERVSCGGGIFGGFMMMNASSNNSSWAFTSPVRAFSSKASSKDNKNSDKNNATPNLSAIPSLLTARG